MFLHDIVTWWKRFRANFLKTQNQVEFELINGGLIVPSKAHYDDVGYDLYAAEDITLLPQQVTAVKTGVKIVTHKKNIFPKVESRSGLALKSIFAVGGIIEPKYKGEIRVLLYNGTSSEVQITSGKKIAQVVFYKYASPVNVKVLFSHERQAAGFGSSD